MINLSKNLVAQFSIGKFKCEDCDEYYFNNAVIFFDYDPETHEINEIQDEILFPTSYYSIDVAIAKHRELARTGMFETADFFSSIDLYDDETGDVVFYDLWTGVIENEYQKKTQEITQTSTALH